MAGVETGRSLFMQTFSMSASLLSFVYIGDKRQLKRGLEHAICLVGSTCICIEKTTKRRFDSFVNERDFSKVEFPFLMRNIGLLVLKSSFLKKDTQGSRR